MEITEHDYPNPDAGKFRSITIDGTYIGSYDLKPDGFLPSGARKVLQSERDAQIKVIQRYVSRHLKLAAEAAAIFTEI